MSKTDLAFLVGLCLITAGVAAMYWPAGLVAAGTLLAAFTWMHDAGRDG